MSVHLPPLTHHVAFPDGPEVDWELRSFRSLEGLDSCGEASLELATEDLQVDTSALLGASCELSLQRGDHPAQHLFGVVTQVEHLGAEGHAVRARVRVEPALALAGQRVCSRIFQDRSVQEIVTEVLAPTLEAHGRTLALDGLRRGAAPRDYCVQYRESDLQFVTRLLEEEGITWFFVHDGDQHSEVLTLCDDASLYPRVENVDGSDHIPLSQTPEGAVVETVQSLEWRERLTSTAAGVSDYDPGSPGSTSAEAWGEPGVDSRGRARRVYDHGQRRLGTGSLGQRAADLGEALALMGSSTSAGGEASIARPGFRFRLDGAESLEERAPREWLVVRAEHGSAGTGDGARVYGNRFECVAADAEIRPMPVTPKPLIHGPQTATVVGGGEIDVDAQGRIQVQMHWQEGAAFAAGASCRVRCAQSWAGGGWGAQFVPRVGMEVIVEFLEGNPDRPLVTGCVYNGGAAPPFALPGNATQSGWRTQSSPGGGGFNELRFEDAVGAEEIYIHGQRDWNTDIRRNKGQVIGQDLSLRVGGKRRKSIQGDELQAVGGDRSLTVVGAQLEAIGESLTLTVGGVQSVTVAKDRSLSVGGSLVEDVAMTASETVGAAKNVSVGGVLMTMVGGAMNTSVGGLSAEEVGGAKSVSVGGVSSESVVGSKSVQAGSISHSATRDIGHSAGGSYSVSAVKDVQLTAEGTLSVRGKKKGLIEVEDSLILKVGKASLTLEKNGTITLDGVKLTLKGKKSITLKSKKINQN